MRYDNIHTGAFLSRPNRFIAMVEMEGKEERCHVKNTGRCRELLIPGAVVYLEKSDAKGRKTAYDLVGVKKGDTLINMDSQAPNRAVKEWLLQGGFGVLDEMKAKVWDKTAKGQEQDIISAKEKSTHPEFFLKPECRYGNSRFDFYMEEKETGRKAYLEVKGVTLEEDKTARFPDAPTERGIKHMEELIKAKEEGYEAYILFVIQMKGIQFLEPNDRTHPAFGEALRKASKAGVHVLACDCLVTEDTMTIDEPVFVKL